MKRTVLAACWLMTLGLGVAWVAEAQSAQVVQLSPAALWSRVEFSIVGAPTATNTFDPQNIRIDGTFTLPSGRTMTVPVFWYQAFQRSLSRGSEHLSVGGPSEWRLRFTPPETGAYSLAVNILTNGQPCGAPIVTDFTVLPDSPPPGTGYVRVATNHQYFETGDGQALRLIGENVCWPGGRGTYDYDDWFAAMQAAGENYCRLWMCPWAFNLETDANSLTHYRLDRAWQLDYVLDLAAQRGIYVLLCLDYHGMFEVEPDYWGGNNMWPSNPYNATNGGPCVNQNAFFTNAAAQRIYQKRLRYLVGRYGYAPNLLAWEFFNEIDNVYRYLNANDVAAWHGVMGGWLHTNDPFGHMATTSLTGSSDRPELWAVPQLDWTAYHSYGEPKPALRLSQVAQSFLARYGKPVMIGEFGTDWRGWAESNDPYLRGFRQGIWGGALGGSVGTAMSWWWENIHSENLYPIYTALGTILKRTGWGRGSWTNLQFHTTGDPPPTVGDLVPGGTAFDAYLPLNGSWGGSFSGYLAIPNATAAAAAPTVLNSFVHGIWHSNMKTPFRLSAWLTNDARIVLHLNSVSDSATLVVRADNTELYRTNLPNLDGGWNVNNEYNMDIPVNLPSGKRLIEVTNAGGDWFYLDWVRLEKVLPATYGGNWVPSPDAIGLRGQRESLLYVVAPGASFPSGATNATLPMQQGQSVTLTNWPAGSFFAEWHDPATGSALGTRQSMATNGSLTLPLPDFREDVAGLVYQPPALSTPSVTSNGAFAMQLQAETGGRYRIEKSDDLTNWTAFQMVTNNEPPEEISEASASTNARGFFRARRP